MSWSFSTALPGQPVVLPPRAPVPQLGTGVYERGGQILASVIGRPQLKGSVRSFFNIDYRGDLCIYLTCRL